MKILLVEDDRHLVELLSFTLLRAGHWPVPAYTSTQALELLVTEQPALVLLDTHVSGQSGLELLLRMRDQTDIPIIVLSDVSSDEQRIQAFELGADDYLTKPFGVRELLARVRARLRRTSTENGDGNADDSRTRSVGRSARRGPWLAHLGPVFK